MYWASFVGSCSCSIGALVTETPLGSDAAEGACALGPLLLEALAVCSTALAALSVGLSTAVLVALLGEGPAAAGTTAVLFAPTRRFLACDGAAPSRDREAAGARFFFEAVL